MGTVNTLVITGYGTNSHLETAHAARLAGADRADVVHFSDIVAAKVRLADYHFLVFPGGFLDGDDLGAAQAAVMRWRYLKDAGLTDPTGRVLGLMPHPEAFHHVTNHPAWTRGELDPPGTLLFVNAVHYLRGQ